MCPTRKEGNAVMFIMPLTKYNIDRVFEDPSKVVLDDLKALGITAYKAKQGYVEAIGQPFCGAICDKNFEPCALFKMQPITDTLWRFSLTDKQGKWKRVMKSSIALAAKISLSLAEDHGKTIELLTCHKESGRWFELMGFKLDDTQDGNIKRYVKGGVR